MDGKFHIRGKPGRMTVTFPAGTYTIGDAGYLFMKNFMASYPDRIVDSSSAAVPHLAVIAANWISYCNSRLQW